MEFSYGIPLTVERVCKVKKVGVYPMNGVNQPHNKSIKTTPNNSKIFKHILTQEINKIDKLEVG